MSNITVTIRKGHGCYISRKGNLCQGDFFEIEAKGIDPIFGEPVYGTDKIPGGNEKRATEIAEMLWGADADIVWAE